MKQASRDVAVVSLLLAVAGGAAAAGDATVVGDGYFFSVGRPPGYIGPMPATFEGDGATTYHVGLDPSTQLYITTDPADPFLDVQLMTVHTETGQQRAYAIVLDFTGVIDRVIAAGYPPDTVGNTTLWFDDIESATAGTCVAPGPAMHVDNVLVLREPIGGGAAVPGNPLRFLDDNSGVTPPVPSDDIFNFDAFGNNRIPAFNCSGEGFVFTLVDWTTLLTHPVIRIEFDLLPEPASVQTLTQQGMMMLILVLIPAGAVYIHRRRRAVVADEPDTWVL